MMTSSNDDRLQPFDEVAQKQEWETPKISLMGTTETNGKLTVDPSENTAGKNSKGPS
jgi:hypothetical protein